MSQHVGPIMHLASAQSVKVRAVQKHSESKIVTHKVKSGVPEQPVGRQEITRGAYNRLSQVKALPAISLETGIVEGPQGTYWDVTLCLLHNRYGIFECWSEKHPISATLMEKWLKMPSDSRQNTTVGSLTGKDPNEWYDRERILADAVQDVMEQSRAFRTSLTADVIPAPLKEFKGVKFLDLQTPLMTHSRKLTRSMCELARNLAFDTVAVMDARGFLLAGGFMEDNYPIVMLRKTGKLPGDCDTVTYKKEYGTDSLSLQKGLVAPQARVLVLDDLVATGGSMLAAQKLLEAQGAQVVAFLAPFVAVLPETGELLAQPELLPKLRFLCTQVEASEGIAPVPPSVKPDDSCSCSYWAPCQCSNSSDNDVYIAPPSMYPLCVGKRLVPIKWKTYGRSSNISFQTEAITGRDVRVLMDPSRPQEFLDVLSLLKILYRKDPSSVTVIIPFLDQATQDRIEYYPQGYETLAQVDTINKLLGPFRVITFDLHAQQSQFAFHDMHVKSLMSVLWDRYHEENPDSVPVFPDDGAAKRFGPLLACPYITFRKIRRGDERLVETEDEIKANHFVIMDDLVRSGGTLRAVADTLIRTTNGKVDTLFAHAPLEPKAVQNLSVFNQVWTSDSCPGTVPPSWVKVRVLDAL